MVAWGASRLIAGEHRWEYAACVVVGPALAFAHWRSRRLMVSMLPFVLVGLLYDAMRYVKNVGLSAGRVHVCDLRALDALLFGSGGETVHDWLQRHPSAWLDRLCALPYGTFVAVTVAFALGLALRGDRGAMARFGWTFFVMNVLGFATYHVYPAAPPWYFHQRGCAVDLGAVASAGPNLLRVDAWLGFSYFRGLYGRSNDVFGSVPSLHVAYPALIVAEGWRSFSVWARAASCGFAALMAFAAVYLDHHWLIDVVLGIVYCAASYALVAWAVTRFGHTGARSAA